VIALALAIFAIPSNFVDGNDLLRMCEPTTRTGTCAAYIFGVADTFTTLASGDGPLKPRICLSQDVNPSALADIVYKHLKDHPRTRQLGAAGHVFEALSAAFPCRRGSQAP
jgi:hypothetical protein